MSREAAVRKFQSTLARRGHNPGEIDGWAGAKTATALDGLLTQLGFDVAVRGNRFDLTVIPMPEQKIEAKDVAADVPPWLALTMTYIGLHEVKDNKALREFLRSDGSTLGDPAQFPWCGDLVHTALKRTLPREPFPGKVGENPYLARNWLEFGRRVTPGVGAVMVFWRGDRNGTFGHVAFYWGEDDRYYYVAGGNQSNMVSVAKIAKGRLLGARWPSTFQGPAPAPRLFSDPKIALSVNEA